MTPTSDGLAVRAEAAMLPSAAVRTDAALIERAARHLRELIEKTVERGMDEAGRYLLREFYGDDPAAYLSKNPYKHASLSKLLERCDSGQIGVSRSFVATSLRMAAIAKSLPRSNAFHHLGISHRVVLLPVRDPETVERLALRAIEDRLSVKRLRTLVHREQARGGRGRKPPPRVIKALRRCEQALGGDEPELGPADVEALSAEERERAIATLRRVERRVAALRGLLR